jgi:hypothetical protein
MEILPFFRRGGGCGLRRTSRRQWLHGERKGVMCEDGFFVGWKSWERKWVPCENGVFCWLQQWGEEKRALGGRRIFMDREPIQPLLKKLLPKRLE